MKRVILIILIYSTSIIICVEAGGPVFTDLSAGAQDAGIVASNPAGMTYLEETTWRTSLIISYSDSTWEATSSNLNRTTKTDTDSTLYIPSLFYVRPINDRWSLGASLSATGGMGDDNGDDSVTRYLYNEWSLGSFTFQPTVAYKINEKWSIGAGLGINYTLYNWEAAVFNGIGQPDGEVEIDSDDIELNFILGVHWAPYDNTKFGITYRSEYSPSLKDTPDYSGVDPSRQSNSAVELEVTIPQNVLAGMHHDFNNGQWMSIDIMWIEASTFNIESAVVDNSGNIVVNPYQLNDTWIFSAGWGMPLNEAWQFGLGIIYVHDPLDNKNRSVLLRADSLWGLGAALEHQMNNGMSIGANLSYLFTGDAPVQTPNLPVVGVVEGEYKDRTNLLFEAFINW